MYDKKQYLCSRKQLTDLQEYKLNSKSIIFNEKNL